MTTLREHQHCMGLADSKLCEEAAGIEDAYHFFFQCTKYSDSRDKLKQDIQHIWTVSGRDGSRSWSVALLLAPFTETAFTRAVKIYWQQHLNSFKSPSASSN